MAKGRGQLIAASGIFAGLGIAAATLIGELVEHPEANLWFIASIVIAAIGFVLLVLASISGAAEWAAEPLRRRWQRLRPPHRLVTNRWQLLPSWDISGRMLYWVRTAFNDAMPNQLEPLQDQPPWLRFVVTTACTAISPDSDKKRLRQRFEAFLAQPQVMSAVRSLTHVNQAARWIQWSGPGSGALDYVLSPAERDGDVAARLVLPYGDNPNWHDRLFAILILHVVPRDKLGQPAGAVVPLIWTKRIETALELPQALAGFLSTELGSRVTGEPEANLGVTLHVARRDRLPLDMTDLVDITGTRPLPGSSTSDGTYHFQGDKRGVPAAQASSRMIRRMLRDALVVELDET